MAKFANLIPRSICKVGLNTIALECGPSKTESAALLSFGDNPAKPLFDKGFESNPLPVG